MAFADALLAAPVDLAGPAVVLPILLASEEGRIDAAAGVEILAHEEDSSKVVGHRRACLESQALEESHTGQSVDSVEGRKDSQKVVDAGNFGVDVAWLAAGSVPSAVVAETLLTAGLGYFVGESAVSGEDLEQPRTQDGVDSAISIPLALSYHKVL